MVVADDIADLVDDGRRRPQFFQNGPGHGRPFQFLVAGGRRIVLSFRFLDADIVEIGRHQDDRQMALFLLADLFRVPGHPGGMADAFEIRLKIAFHLHRHPVFQEVGPLVEKFFGQGAETLLGKGAVSRAPEIQPGVDDFLAALAAFAVRVILEELDNRAAIRAFLLVNRAGFPILTILSGTFHGILLC